MSSRVRELVELKRITPPKWLPDNIMYETVMGSVAYGVSNDMSDCDIYGFCIPPKAEVFPHLRGEIPGFGRQHRRFEQFQQHHIDGSQTSGHVDEYDISIYSIVKFFQLCMENNPNMVDALFTPRRCVLHSTPIAEMLRERRQVFLHKGCWHKFKGYAYAQLSKMERSKATGKRQALIEEHGFDVKFAYHVVRLVNEVQQILESGDLVLDREDSREQMKAIRRGEWTQRQVRDYFDRKERELESLYEKSALPYGPDETKIKALLLECLEQHYGSVADAVQDESVYLSALREIQSVLDRVR